MLPAPALASRMVDPALAPPDVVLPDVVLPVWLTLVPFVDAEPDADADADADWLALVDADADVVTFGLSVCVLVGSGSSVGVGVRVRVGQGVAVAWAVVLSPVALVFALAETVEALAEGVVVAVPVGVTVVLGVAVTVLVAVVLSLGFVLLAGLVLVLLAGLVALAAGATLGDADLLALFEGDGEEHAVAIALGWLLGMLLRLTRPAEADSGLPVPAPLWGPLLLWEEVIPTAELSWTKAWRSGGTARATPTANTAQAAARAGRSSPSRQSRG